MTIAVRSDGSWKTLLVKYLGEEHKQDLARVTGAVAEDLLLVAAGQHDTVVSIYPFHLICISI